MYLNPDEIIKVDPAHFGETVRRLRKQRGWSQEEIATKMNTKKQVISHYERGARIPKISTVAKCAEALGVSFLICGEDQKEKPERKQEV